MEAGIIGLPYIGKTTLFNALTAMGVAGESGGRPNVGVVQVPDPRLETIAQFIPTQKIIHATLQLVDVAGLAAGASEGKGSGNKFLAHVRNVDALIHVVRCFADESVPHLHGRVDPVSDVEEVELELIFADLEVVENSLKNAQRKARTGDRESTRRLEVLNQCKAVLEDGRPVSSMGLDDADLHLLKSHALLTLKPVLLVANIGEDDLQAQSEPVRKLRSFAEEKGREMVAVCAKLDAELVELVPEERAEMLSELGLAEPALNTLARAIYKVLGLQSFFTAGPKEVRAWPIRIGSTAPIAAGAIHSDIERGFIRVETYSVDDLVRHKTEQAIKAAGKLRVEGKSYIIQDGDVCHYLFNV
ncbi:MAG: redox-regulated ATPase YchF [Phycisphaeraceae bacterium]|nr:redox-regulated ATPase YchF [Phycisphaeraceae bacterium]